MSVQSFIKKESITETFKVIYSVGRKQYPLQFDVVDGMIPTYKKVMTSKLEYFSFSENTRERHFDKILIFLGLKPNNKPSN